MKNLLFLLFITSSAIAQDKELTIESSVMGYYQGLYPQSLKWDQWLTDADKYAHVKESSYFILPAKALPDARVAEQITLKSIQENITDLKRLPYAQSISSEQLVFDHNGNQIIYNYKGDNTGKFSSIHYPASAANNDFNFNTKTIAYTADNNLYLATEKDSMIVITNSNDKNIVSGQAIHRYEFGISKGTFWSPTGNSLAFYQKDETNVADYPLLDITTRTGSLKSIKYPMAGEASEHGRVGIYNVINNKTIYLQTGEPLEHYVSNVTWSPDEKTIFIVEMNRGQDHFWFNEYDAITGEKIKTLFEEKHSTFLQPIYEPYFIPGKIDQFVWLSERDGFFNIYLYNTEGILVNKLTDFKWEVTGIKGFNNKNNSLIFEGTSEDGRELHAYSVDITSKKVTQLTKTKGVHHAKLHANGKYLLDSYSNLATPNQVDIIETEKGSIVNLFTAPNPLSEHKTGQIELIELKAKDGTALYGRMIKPSNFDKNKKYPVLVYVYGGPGVQLITNSWNAGASLWMNWLAEQDYIVFTIDNRGTSNRGRKFKEVIHKQCGTVEIEDQIVGVEYLKSLSFVDSDRMAVHGWSYGGFMTTSLMTRAPGTFTTGVAGGPVLDWKWYEVMYGERYMDTPQENPEGYKTASPLTYVNDLEGKLLLIHGTVDDVVVMQHSLAFVQKCVEEGVQIDFFPYPMHPHNVSGKDRVHLMTKVLNYIMENNK
jgi:dipeptidyl-peptidase 4